MNERVKSNSFLRVSRNSFICGNNNLRILFSFSFPQILCFILISAYKIPSKKNSRIIVKTSKPEQIIPYIKTELESTSSKNTAVPIAFYF